MKVIVNTLSTKKNSGGAFQIAYNFLLETLVHAELGVEWYYFTSADLDSALGNNFTDIVNNRYFVFPTQPDFKKTYFQVKNQISEIEQQILPDLIYTISSPSYFSFSAPEVMRFTNPWVTHPNSYSWSVLNISKKIRTFFYCIIQKCLMRQASYFVTQTETTKQGIVRVTGIDEHKVCVVPNVLPALYRQYQPHPKKIIRDCINIACVAAPVPHKNLDIIPDILKDLKDNYKLEKVNFYITVPEQSEVLHAIYKKLKKYNIDKTHIVNIGRCSQQQLVSLYNECQICLFPSLLEVFSATLLEAMYFGLYVVATDFQFNKDVLSNAGLYYQPMIANDAAAKIYKIIFNEQLRHTLDENMKERLTHFGDYNKHFVDIVNFLKSCIK